MAAKLILDIITDASKAVTGLKQVSGATETAGKNAEKTQSKWKTMAAGAAKLAGAAALGGVVALFKTGMDEQKDFLAGQAQLANGLKSTGNAAHTTVGHMENLASSIQNYSGQTDDSIVASEKLLLTFTNIQNRGKGANAIFDRATTLTADMAAKMGGDASKYAIQLGKALNDPVKGLTALTRIGVSFTAGQQKMIKHLAATGQTMKAQKIIIGEVNREFGGSAKAAGQTLPGQLARARRSFEDIAQSLIASLMPVLTMLANFLTSTVMPAFAAVMGFITRNKTIFTILAATIGTVVAAWKIWNGVLLLWTAITEANPIFLIVTGLVALGIALVVAYKKCETFRKIVQGAFKAVMVAVRLLVKIWTVQFDIIKKIVQTVLDFLLHSPIVKVLLGPWTIAINAVKALVQGGISGLLGYFRGLLSSLGTILSRVFDVVTTPFKNAWNWVIDHAKSFVTNLGTWLGQIAGKVTSALAGTYNAIITPFKNAWNWVKDNVIGKVSGAFSNIPGKVTAALRGTAAAIEAPFSTAWGWIQDHVITPIKNAFTGAAGAIGRALRGVADAIESPFLTAWNWIKKNVINPIKNIGTDIKNGIKAPINWLIDKWNALSFHIGGWKLPFPPHTQFPSVTISTPPIPRLAGGGYARNPTLALVGEGGPEIVAPEPMLRAIIRQELAAGGIHITVNGALDPDRVARQIEDMLEQRRRRVRGVVTRGGSLFTGSTA